MTPPLLPLLLEENDDANGSDAETRVQPICGRVRCRDQIRSIINDQENHRDYSSRSYEDEKDEDRNDSSHQRIPFIPLLIDNDTNTFHQNDTDYRYESSKPISLLPSMRKKLPPATNIRILHNETGENMNYCFFDE
eukprot:CAMPEP_0194193574 /NCGR_PEP_ID=MMETSP0154-20130528/75115_1 /TAXON_ID=1049557 /ORGANISM="Thalassiothrix antarctica, Strain L6-D1" /LENGTH=135 /DNA_ID=CAMNT_0038917931 /DNA_START=111 /DNA_END=518 /DNA_ORIENTATION=+